jgi:hypothetical protein
MYDSQGEWAPTLHLYLHLLQWGFLTSGYIQLEKCLSLDTKTQLLFWVGRFYRGNNLISGYI